MAQEVPIELVAARHEWLLRRLEEQQRISTNAAAQDLGVSVDTIRRDLRALHDRGALQRVHGGAVRTAGLASSFSGRKDEPSGERSRLAAGVVDRLQHGQVVGLDAGTTSTEICSLIPPHLAITIVTNNPAAALALADHPSASVLLLGGEVDLNWMAVTGPTAVEAIGETNLDLAVVGVCSFGPEAGATTRSRSEVSTKRAFVAAAAHTIVPVESEKLGTVAPFRVAGASEVEVLVVEEALTPAARSSYQAAGVDLTTV